MKVILTEDVPKVGKKYEECEVAPGFARNFLLPNEKAVLPGIFNEETLTKLREEATNQNSKKQTEIDELFKTLPEKKVTIKAKASDEGHLFAGLKADKIAEALEKEYNTSFLPEVIHLDEPIKSIGSHRVKVGDNNTLEVVVEKEEE